MIDRNSGDLCKRCGVREVWFVTLEESYNRETGRAISVEVPDSGRCRECSEIEQEEYREELRKAGML